MKINVDLTRALFSDLKLVSFYDSKTLFFQPPRELPSSLSFEVWGADILPTFPWGDFLSNEEIKTFENRLSEPPDRVTVRGLGVLSFEGLKGGFCSLTPRDPAQVNGGFFSMANGEVFSIKRDWPFDKDVAGLHRYVFEGADIEFPRSAAYIEFYGTGKVTFEFDLDDCVTTREYWRT